MAERRNVPPEVHGGDVDRQRSVDNQEVDDTPQAPETPGAIRSPQHPGQVPDRSTIPGQFSKRVPRARQVIRPLTEAGSAQSIMNVYAAKPGAEMDPMRFEQATATYEELRKAYPAQLPPPRPGPGYALETGDRMASEMQATSGPGPAPALPAVASGEAYNARPGGGTAALGAPGRADAPAAQVGSAFSPSDAPAGVRGATDATTPMTSGAGATGTSSLGSDAPSPGDATSLAGTMPSAKDGETDIQRGPKDAPPTSAPQ